MLVIAQLRFGDAIGSRGEGFDEFLGEAPTRTLFNRFRWNARGDEPGNTRQRRSREYRNACSFSAPIVVVNACHVMV